MDRRQFIAAGIAFAASAEAPRAAPDDMRAAAREAWLYGLPLIETAAARSSAIGRGASINSFQHVRELATPLSRSVTTPNCDTLYSTAWLDLSAGPVTVVVPAMGERYFS